MAYLLETHKRMLRRKRQLPPIVSIKECAPQRLVDYPTICKLPDVSVCGDPSVLAVEINGQQAILSESFNYDHSADQLQRLRPDFSDCVRVAGDWMALNSLWCDNIWHWMTECLPKVLMAEKAGFLGRYLVPANRSFVDESLDLLGVDLTRVVPAAERCLRVETLYVPPRVKGNDLCGSPLGAELRSTLLAAVNEPTGEERIYIARRGTRRVIVNDAETGSLLSSHGFRQVFMEELTLREQIELMKGCRALVLPHGAGAIHMLFMPPGSLVVELFSPAYINPTMLPVVRHLGHRYFMVPSYWNPKNRKEPYVHGDSIEAFIEAIDAILARELSK